MSSVILDSSGPIFLGHGPWAMFLVLLVPRPTPHAPELKDILLAVQALMVHEMIPEGMLALLERTQAFFQRRGIVAYIVGGLLRDQALGRALECRNVDLAVSKNALLVSQDLAADLKGAFVLLDKTTGTARVVVADEQQHWELDISDFRGPTLEEDLRRRDFTINAMAISLADWLRSPDDSSAIIDPLGGAIAVKAGKITACYPQTFLEDPLRILRAFRFAAQLEFALDSALPALMREAAPELLAVSGERLRDELLLILETDRAHPALNALDEVGALGVILPEVALGRDVDQGPFHHLDVMKHELETAAQADRFLKDFAEFIEPLRKPLADYCRECLVERRSRKALIKLAGLLHDIGKPARRSIEADGEIWFYGHEQTGAEMVIGITERLRLSNRESEMVRLLVLHHLRPGFLSREPQLTNRAVFRFFRDLKDHGPACLLLWWSDRMATRGPKSHLDQVNAHRGFVEEMLQAYFFKAEQVVKPPQLIDGYQLMEAFHLTPSPLIGELLEAIMEAQAEGRVSSKEQALACAQDLLKARKNDKAHE